jgi:hypothetical protein
MSGDMDTGLGNCIIMNSLIKMYMKLVGIKHYLSSVNGDDSVVLIEADQEKLFRSSMYLWKRFGFNMKCDIVYSLEDVDYCQCKPLLTDYGWVMSRDPKRVLSRIAWSTKLYPKRGFGDYLYALGTCERATSWGVPVNFSAGQNIFDLSFKFKGQRKLRAMSRKLLQSVQRQKYWQCDTPCEISYSTRLRFQRAWNLDPVKQIELENIQYSYYIGIPHSIWVRYSYLIEGV